MELVQRCLNAFDSLGLKKLGELQQDLATAFDDQGDSLSRKQLTKRLLDACNDPEIRFACLLLACVVSCVAV